MARSLRRRASRFGTAFSLLAAWLLMAAPAAQAQESQFFDSDGVQIHYVDQGEGEPVVLMHGFSGSVARTFSEIMEALVSDGYRVVAYDARGHGQTSKPREAAAYGLSMVEDVRRLLDHLELSNAHFVGYSMGSRTLLKFLTLYPERIRTATIGGFGWPTGPPRLRSEEEIRAVWARRGLLDELDPKASAVLRTRLHELDVEEEQLRRNTIPTLAIVGDDDALLPFAQNLAEVAANTAVVLVPGNHTEARSHPKFLTELLTFLNRYRK